MTKRLSRITTIAAFAAFLGAVPAASADGGVTPGDTPPPVLSVPGKEQVPGSKVVVKGGLAYAPAAAPEVVKQIVWAANKIRNKPYFYGGGHGPYVYDKVARAARLDSRGYDCSGSVSFALHGAGLLNTPLVSGAFPAWSKARRGYGKWVTIFANGGHVFMTVAGARFDTSGARPSRWQTSMRSPRGYTVVHPAGL